MILVKTITVIPRTQQYESGKEEQNRTRGERRKERGKHGKRGGKGNEPIRIRKEEIKE